MMSTNLKKREYSQLINIYCDGGARGNPGPAAIGIIVKNLKNHVLYQESKYIGIATNNVAEYESAIGALNWLKDNYIDLNIDKVKMHMDSSLVVNQLSGKFKIKNALLKKLYKNAKKIESEIGVQNNSNFQSLFSDGRGLEIKYIHIPRASNVQADSLVNLILDKV
jgi:ribonuclease HI